MTQQEAETFLDAPDSATNAPASAARSGIQPAAPEDSDSEPLWHYAGRSPIVQDASALAGRVASSVVNAGRDVGSALNTGAEIVNAPNRFAGWLFKRGVVDPGLQIVKEGASGLGDLYNDATDAVAGPMATAMNWFQRRVLPPAVGNSRVRMRAPDGTTGSIPAWQVEDAKKKGYKIIGTE